MVYEMNLFENSRNSPIISVENVDFDDENLLSHESIPNFQKAINNMQQ